ncbi:hypothetical protein AB0C76_39455 [Kitasatospora sp. NPDC048722]|uniref:hypothetical protein n=1 Tax=Kitasatospora sp. NPDC048722 TaxID=3155639 RepID=UPI0034049A9E
MLKVRALALAAVAAGSLALGTATAAPASATTTDVCQEWWDGNTYGAMCPRSDSHIVFRAMAVCQNGENVYGPWKPTGSGLWSYAYCTSVNSSLLDYFPQFK